jgi:hypothetical protein
MAGDVLKKVPGLLSPVLLLALTLTASRCNDDLAWRGQQLIFVLPMNILPDNSEVIIGDTLWVTAAIPDSVYEFNTKKRYKLHDTLFVGGVITVMKLVDKNLSFAEQLGAAGDFDLIEEKGAIVDPSTTFVGFKFLYDGFGIENLKIGFRPKRTGVYCFQFLRPYPNKFIDKYVNLGRDSNGAVIRPVYEGLYFTINMDGNNNYDLFADHCRALYYDNLDSVGYYREFKGTFTFRVLE